MKSLLNLRSKAGDGGMCHEPFEHMPNHRPTSCQCALSDQTFDHWLE